MYALDSLDQGTHSFLIRVSVISVTHYLPPEMDGA